MLQLTMAVRSPKQRGGGVVFDFTVERGRQKFSLLPAKSKYAAGKLRRPCGTAKENSLAWHTGISSAGHSATAFPRPPIILLFFRRDNGSCFAARSTDSCRHVYATGHDGDSRPLAQEIGFAEAERIVFAGNGFRFVAGKWKYPGGAFQWQGLA